MKNKTMTAVEWVLQKILIENGIVNSDIEQAYKMEKEQIIDAYLAGYSATENQGDSEQYYNEIYKKEDK